MWQSNFLRSRLCEKHHLKRKRVGKREHTRHNSFKYSRQGGCQQIILFVHFVYFHGHMISLFFSLQVLLILCMARKMTVSGKDLVPGTWCIQTLTCCNGIIFNQQNSVYACFLTVFCRCSWQSILYLCRKFVLKHTVSNMNSLWQHKGHWYFSQVDTTTTPSVRPDTVMTVSLSSLSKHAKGTIKCQCEMEVKTERFCQGWNQRATYAVLPR